MADSIPSSLNFSIMFIVLLFFLNSAETFHPFSQNISPATLGLKREKLTHLHFYFHDLFGAPHATSFRIAAPKNVAPPIYFGSTVVIDEPLTVLPKLSSKMVGRAQGIYTSASQTEVGYLMVFNFAFTEGKYNGSNLSVLGRNVRDNAVREMPIVGGSGLLRFARGYAEARTHYFNTTSGYTILQFDVYVFHY